MKTQLLEDIGQSAALSLTPSTIAGSPTAGKAVPNPAPARTPAPPRPRSALGVWRQKPAAEPVISPPPQPEPPPAAPALRDVLEEIAALEAQYVPPAEKHEPAAAPVEVRHALPVPPVPPLPELDEIAALEAQYVPPADKHEPAIAPADPRHELSTPPPLPELEEIAALEAQYVPPADKHEPSIAPAEPRDALPTPPLQPEPAIPAAAATPDPHLTHNAAARQDPLFDFTPPPPAAAAAAAAPAAAAADPFTPAPTWRTRSRQRYLLWGACVLSAALLVQGGRWLYQERNDAGSLALIASQAKEQPRVDTAVQRQAIAATEAAPGVDNELRAAPAVPASRPAPNLPPLVMLEPDPPAATEPEQPPASAADRTAPETAPKKPEPVAKRRLAAPSPKPPSRTARAQSDAKARPATKRAEREPVRQLARASAIGPGSAPEPDTSMTATLKACRAHGYHAAQCIKRECSVTKHGFVCRGR